MKRIPLVIFIVLSVMLAACAAPAATEVYVPEFTMVPVIEVTAQPAITQINPEETPYVIPDMTLRPGKPNLTPMIPPPIDWINTQPVSQGPVSYTIKLEDNGMIFNLHVGDNILLDLGADAYDWDATVDHQSLISRRAGNAQIVFDAVGAGTAKITAVGNPKCLNSTPPCMMPSILFAVTVIVQ